MKNHETTKWFRRILSFAMCVCMLAGIVGMCVFNAQAAELQDAAKLALAPKASETITLDGDFSEAVWQNADKNYIEFLADFTISNNVSFFKTAWDAENLYIAVEVQDATVVTAENGVLSDNIYENDSIEIFIDGDNAKTASFDKVNDYHFFIQHDGRIDVWGGAKGPWTSCMSTFEESFDYEIVMTEAGFNLELSVKLEAIGAVGTDGSCIGLNVVNNDIDNLAGGDRKEIMWNSGNNAAKPNSWGAVALYETRKPVISTYGTPKIGQNKLTNWDPSIWNFSDEYSLNFKNAEGATMKFASLSDYEGLYIALWAEGLGDVNPFAEVALSGTNVRGDGSRVEYDHVMQWNPGAAESWQKMNITSKLPAGVAKSSASDKYDLGDGSYAVVIKFPWDQLGTIEDPVNPRKNYSVMSFGIETGNDAAVAEGENTEWVSEFNAWWNPFRNVATLLINNPNIVEMDPNVAPTGNPLFAYSIPQGGSISGNVNVIDANEGDVLTYALEEGFDTANGTVEVDPATGAWTYTTPNADFVQANRSGVNFWIITTDAEGLSFRTRIQVNVEPTPTNLTYYIDGDTGNDSNDGLSYATALKTFEAADQRVKPGDTVLVYESEVPYAWHDLEEYEADPNLYGSVRNGAISLNTSGLPEAHITYKAAEGQTPVIKANGVWETVSISGNYIDFEGFTVKGQNYDTTYEGAFMAFWAKLAPKDSEEYSSDWNYPCGLYNTNGLGVGPESGISEVTDANANVPHHITIRNCVFEGLAASGVGGSNCDYVTIDNVTSINNGWTEMYGSSGIGFITTIDIDDNTETYKIIIRDSISAGNRHFIPWKANTVRLSDGNGIIFDTMDDHAFDYQGKCLVANNLVFENGGSGIHTFRSDNIDFVNNTVFNNGTTPEMGWSELFANDAEDINMYNNLVYSRTGNKEDIKSSTVKNVVYDYNLFFNYASGSNVGTVQSGMTVGENNIYGEDPLFANVYSDNRWDAHKPEGFNPDTDYDEDWYIVKTADSSITPGSWSAAANAKAAGWYPGVNYDAMSFGYDVTLADNSPAWGAADAEWQAIAGGAEYDNVIGIFGNVGADLEDVEDPIDPEDPEDPTDPTDPEDPTEPEVTEPEVTGPEVTEPEVTEPEVPATSKPAGDNDSADTGDNSFIVLWSGMMLITLMGGVMLLVFRRKWMNT